MQICLSVYSIILLVALFLVPVSSYSQSPISEDSDLYSDEITAYIFLLDQCIISQYYTLPLREMHAQFGDQVQFKGIFPTAGMTIDRISDFGETYQLKFELSKDDTDLVDKFKATVTPEVVLYDEKKQTILYQGRIDNSYASLGRRRRITTTHEMLSAVKSILKQTEIRVTKTDAVGCYIGTIK